MLVKVVLIKETWHQIGQFWIVLQFTMCMNIDIWLIFEPKIAYRLSGLTSSFSPYEGCFLLDYWTA